MHLCIVFCRNIRAIITPIHPIIHPMYTQIWSKYLPIIKILLKRTLNGDQVLDLNRIDFERAGSGRKAGYKFSIEFTRGRVANIISGSALASDLAFVMLEDETIKPLLLANHYVVSLNTKFQLSLKNVTPGEEVAADNANAAGEA